MNLFALKCALQCEHTAMHVLHEDHFFTFSSVSLLDGRTERKDAATCSQRGTANHFTIIIFGL